MAIQTKICECGCSQNLNRFDSRGRVRKFIHGHNNKGYIPWNKGLDLGGSEYLSKRISWLTFYRKWKLLIKQRDSNRCIICNSDQKLNVDHHPISLAELIRKYNIKKPQETIKYTQFWNLKNGRTLCIDCHKKTKTYGKNFVQKM